MKRGLVAGVVVFLALFFLVCCEKKEIVEGIEDAPKTYACKEDATFVDDGIFMKSAALRYVDRMSGEEFLLCADPTCEHKYPENLDEGITCVALQRAADLYFIPVGDVYYSLKGRADKSSLYRESMDGLQRELIAEVDAQWVRGMQYFDDSVLVYYRNDYLYEDAGADGDVPLREKPLVGCALISLQDGSVSYLVQKEEETNWIVQAYYDGTQLIYSYETIRSTGGTDKAISEIFCYTVQTGEERLLAEFVNANVSISEEGILVHQENPDVDYLDRWHDYEEQLYEIKLDGTKTEIARGVEIKDYFYCSEGVVYHSSDADGEKQGTYHYYNIKTGETQRLGDGECQMVCAVCGDVIYTYAYRDDGELMYGWISVEDFLGGAYDKVSLLAEVNESRESYR